MSVGRSECRLMSHVILVTEVNTKNNHSTIDPPAQSISAYMNTNSFVDNGFAEYIEGNHSYI